MFWATVRGNATDSSDVDIMWTSPGRIRIYDLFQYVKEEIKEALTLTGYTVGQGAMDIHLTYAPDDIFDNDACYTKALDTLASIKKDHVVIFQRNDQGENNSLP